ncbi:MULTISPECIES: hypothetical protein [unclassified Frankia]|nr:MULTISPECIES: hypothetical protein [unclassified Frankia]
MQGVVDRGEVEVVDAAPGQQLHGHLRAVFGKGAVQGVTVVSVE